MKKEIFIITHSFNEAYSSCRFFEVVGAFSTEELAERKLKEIERGINNRTLHYLKDVPFKEIEYPIPGVKGISFEWSDYGCDFRMFTNFAIEKIMLEEE